MTTELTHDEIRDLLAVYALDAVDGDERDLLEGHLAGCPQCRAEVADHRETAALLASAGASAPEGLWDRIAASLEEAPPALELAPVVPMQGRAAGSEARVAATSSRPRRPVRWIAAAAAAAVIAVLGVQVVRLSDRVDRQDREADLASVLRDPDSQVVQLTSVDESADVEVVIDEDGVAHLVRHSLPALPSDRTYQVWAVVGGEKISLGLLGNAPQPTAMFRVSPGAQAIALTEEVAGGVEESANPVVVVGSVSA